MPLKCRQHWSAAGALPGMALQPSEETDQCYLQLRVPLPRQLSPAVTRTKRDLGETVTQLARSQCYRRARLVSPVLTILLQAAGHCTALHHTALYYTVLHCNALHFTSLHCFALHCTVFHCTKRHFPTPYIQRLLNQTEDMRTP